MPKEYEHCVETERKKHDLKTAKRICAIAYWKRHGVSVIEAEKREKAKKKSVSTAMVYVARTKKALEEKALELAQKHGLSKDDFVILPLVDQIRSHAKVKALAPKAELPEMKYILIKKSVGNDVIVDVTLEGKLKLNLDALPENEYAAGLNVPERYPAESQEVVDAKPETKSVAAEEEKKEEEKDEEKAETKCKGSDCAEEKAETKHFEPERMEKLPDVVDEGVMKALEVLETLVTKDVLTEDEVVAVKNLLNALTVSKSLLEQEAVEKAVKAEDEEEEKEEKEENYGHNKEDLDTLGKVMSKVAKGEELTEVERKILSGAIDGAKKETGKTSEEAKDTLGKVMSKVAKGEKLTDLERKVLAAAVDAAKKAKTEVKKSINELVAEMKEELNPLAEADLKSFVYMQVTGVHPTGELLGFTTKSVANKFVNLYNSKSTRDKAYVDKPTLAERRQLGRMVKFVVRFE